MNKKNKVEEVQKPVVYSAIEQIRILNVTKIPDKGPQEKDQKTNFNRAKYKPHDNNVDVVSGGFILVEDNLIEKFCKVVVDGDRVVEIVENETFCVKSSKNDNWIKLSKGSKDIGMMKPTIKPSKLSPEVFFRIL